MDNLEEQLRVAEEKSRVIREKQAKQDKEEAEMNEDFQSRCEGPLRTIFLKILEEQRESINAATTNGIDDGPSEQRVQKIRDLMKNGDFDTLARYIIKLDNETGHKEERSALQLNDQVFFFIILSRSYLFDDFVSRCSFCLFNVREGTNI